MMANDAKAAEKQQMMQRSNDATEFMQMQQTMDTEEIPSPPPGDDEKDAEDENDVLSQKIAEQLTQNDWLVARESRRKRRGDALLFPQEVQEDAKPVKKAAKKNAKDADDTKDANDAKAAQTNDANETKDAESVIEPVTEGDTQETLELPGPDGDMILEEFGGFGKINVENLGALIDEYWLRLCGQVYLVNNLPLDYDYWERGI